MTTIFEKILNNEMKSWKVWEDEEYLAFLTPFPNTPGLTVVIPKTNQGDYIFNISEEAQTKLINASRKVAKILEKAFNTSRVALVVEGTGVPYVHVKLYPLHGELGERTNLLTTHQEFHPEYIGYLSTAEGPKMDDAELDAIQQKILQARR
jgi:beta-aspartyl-peptidase (threonine type)